MAYFKIGNTDYSSIVNSLVISKTHNYTAQTNAAGDTVVDYINNKRTITVGIIPLGSEDMEELLTDLDAFSVSISFRNPSTNALENNILCVIPNNNIEYYTIQQNKVMYKALSLTFIEL